MKELLITLITLAGLFIGVYYHDSLAGGGQADQQKEMCRRDRQGDSSCRLEAGGPQVCPLLGNQ